MDTATASLATVGRRYYTLRGLLLVPTGLLFVAAGWANMPPIGSEPVPPGAAWFLLALAAAAAGYYAADRYYGRTFGRVELATGTKVRQGAYVVVMAALIALGITLDTRFDLPISCYGIAFAVSFLGYYHLLVGLRPYHWACLGGLAAVCLVPVWRQVDDPVSVTMVLIGAVTVVLGLCDHRELVRTIGTPHDARA